MNKILVYADGSSSHPKSGRQSIGWGWVLVANEGIMACGQGGYHQGTNNVGELMAIREGLLALTRQPWWRQGLPLAVVSDSQYALNMAAGRWAAVKNQEIIKHIQDLCQAMRVLEYRWVRGHADDPFNIIADRLAREGRLAVDAQMPLTTEAAAATDSSSTFGTNRC